MSMDEPLLYHESYLSLSSPYGFHSLSILEILNYLKIYLEQRNLES